MDQRMLIEKFAAMGARARFGPMVRPLWRRKVQLPRVTLDVAADRRGEFFDIRIREGVSVAMDVLDLRRDLRHLLLVDRDGDERHRYLCGHDERHWFVAAVPEANRAGTVEAAFRALQPPEVQEQFRRANVRWGDRLKRRNVAFVRQGEWFFVPEPGLEPPRLKILCNEPLSRGTGSKPHRMEFAFRRGGRRVYVSPEHPAGISESEFQQVMRRDRRGATERERRAAQWQVMVQDPEVYARGCIRHPDHATIRLAIWHRVYMNTENQAAARRHVVFLD